MSKAPSIHFSIVVPCFNEEEHIESFLLSLEKQAFDFSRMEVIVVDNASDDRTAQIVWDFASGSKMKIRVVHEYQKGVSRARNAGAAVAAGETIVFLDADNTFDQKFLSRIYEVEIGKCCVAGSIKTMPDRFSLKGHLTFLLLELIKWCSPKSFGKSFVKRDIFIQSGGFNVDIALGENVEFLDRVCKLVRQNGGRFGHVRPGILCSLRRFDKAGYIPVLTTWLVAYLGFYGQGYAAMTELEER